MKIIGVDVGGTFTDIILGDLATGDIVVHKVPSTPDSQDIAVEIGITELLEREGINPSDITLIVHGTTVATNAMLQRKGANVCLITTAGLEDVLEIGRQNRSDIYSLVASRPEPLVKRENRLGIKERLDYAGEIIQELDDDEIDKVVREVTEKKPDSVAVSLLFSFRNPTHEQRVKEKLQRIQGVYIVTSSEVLPEFREFERTSTTVLEAYLGPLVVDYLSRLDHSVKEICPNSKLTVMQSNGGTMLASKAHGHAVGLAISGLAGGVIGGWEVSRSSGLNRVITLDMGGTSCDISAITDRVIVRPDNEVANLPLRTPSVDVKTIGAGGGSIGWVDIAGILHVGPQSAGAEPGPASYEKGGVDATVTDANLLAGRLNADYFLGGRIKLNTTLAESAIETLSQKIGISREDTITGIIRISTANMVAAIREVTVERGKDPRDFSLVPFGGAGSTQAVDIAESLSIDRIIVPRYPGITSAYGLICADIRTDIVKSILISEENIEHKEVERTLEQLSDIVIERLIAQSVLKENILIDWKFDMRYKGQSHEIEIAVPPETLNFISQTKSQFELEHEKRFGYRLKDRSVEWVSIRVIGTAPQDRFTLQSVESGTIGEPVSERDVLLPNGKKRTALVFRRDDLVIEKEIHGPAIIEQIDTTTYIAPGWRGIQQVDGTFEMRRGVND